MVKNFHWLFFCHGGKTTGYLREGKANLIVVVLHYKATPIIEFAQSTEKEGARYSARLCVPDFFASNTSRHLSFA